MKLEKVTKNESIYYSLIENNALHLAGRFMVSYQPIPPLIRDCYSGLEEEDKIKKCEGFCQDPTSLGSIVQKGKFSAAAWLLLVNTLKKVD